MPGQTESLLALVLSPKHVSAGEVRFVDGELQVSILGDIPVPEGAFDANQIANGEVLGRALAEFMIQKRLTARKAVMVLPEGSSITQLIKLPIMPREDMLGAVRSVAERYAMFAEHTISSDCAVVEELEEDGVQKHSVLLAASRAANVEQCQEAARVAGLDLVSVESPAVATARSYRDRFLPSQVVALAVVGDVKTDVMIFDGGVLRLCYSANAGLPEQVAGGDWMTPPPEQFDPFTPPPQLYSELSHCFRFFQNQFPARAVERVILTADHPKADVIASHLAAQLQLPVELGRPSHEFRLPRDVDESIASVARSLTLALFRGSALAGLHEGEYPFPVNLLPPFRAAWAPMRQVTKIAAGAMALVLAASVLWAVAIARKINRQERQLASVQAEVERLRPELEALRAAKATEQALRSGVERETARIAKEQAVRWSQILVDVSQRLPHDMWLTQLTSPDDQKISLTGIATNRETIPLAIESLGTSPYLKNVVLGSLTKDELYAPGRVVIRYQINAQLLRGMLPLPPSSPSTAAASPARPKETTL
jgi:Tfp pilus assembly PilM family ATPase/Tfp pilus assembly protein PilN